MESPLCAPVDPDFRLIETLAWRPGQGFVRRDRHLSRMERSAAAMGLPFSRRDADACLGKVGGPDTLRCRLTMDAQGAFEVATGALAPNPAIWKLAVSDTRLSSADPWLYHKTTRRVIYDNARAALPAGVDELLFLNENDELCEGTITNLFIETTDGRRLTPILSCGLLPGILRQEMLDRGEAVEARLILSDLKDARNAHMGNSLRGLIPVKWVDG